MDFIVIIFKWIFETFLHSAVYFERAEFKIGKRRHWKRRSHHQHSLFSANVLNTSKLNTFTLTCVGPLSLTNHTQKSLGPEIQVRQKRSYHDMYNWHGRFIRWLKQKKMSFALIDSNKLLGIIPRNKFTNCCDIQWTMGETEIFHCLRLGQSVSWELHKVNLRKGINSFSDAG